MYGTESRKNFFHSNSIMNLTRNHLQNLIEHEVQQVDESSKVKAVKRLIKNNPEIGAALKKISAYLMDEKTGLMQHRFDTHSWHEKISNWLRGSDYLNNIPTNEFGVSADPIGLRLKKHVETKNGEEIEGPLEWEDIAEFLQDVYDKHAKQLFKESKIVNEGKLEAVKKLYALFKKFKDAGGKITELPEKWRKWYEGWVENTNPPLFKRMPRVPKPKALRAKSSRTWDFQEMESDHAIDAVKNMIQDGYYPTGKDKNQAIEDLVDLIARRQDLNRDMKGGLYDLDSLEGKLHSEFPVGVIDLPPSRPAQRAVDLRAHLRKELGLGPERPKKIAPVLDHDARVVRNHNRVARREEEIATWDREYEYDVTGNVIKKRGPFNPPDMLGKIAPSLRSSHPLEQGNKYLDQLFGFTHKRPGKFHRQEWAQLPDESRADILGVTEEKLADIEAGYPGRGGGPYGAERSYLNYEFKFEDQIEKWDKTWQERASAVEAWDKKYPGWHPDPATQGAALERRVHLPDIPTRPGAGHGLYGPEFPGKSWSKSPWFSDKESYESFIHNKRGPSPGTRPYKLTPEESLDLANAMDKVNAARRASKGAEGRAYDVGAYDKLMKKFDDEIFVAEREYNNLKRNIKEKRPVPKPGARPSEEWPDPNSPHKKYVRKHGTYREFVQSLPRTWEEYLQNLKKKQDEWDKIFEPILTKHSGEQLDLFKEQNEMNTLTKQQLKRLIVEMLPPMNDTTETILSDVYDDKQEYTPEELEFWELFGPVVDGTVEEIIEVSDIVSREQIPVLINWMRNTGIEKLGIVADELELGEKPMNENTFRKLVREEAIKLKRETQAPIREHDIKQMITDVLEEEMAEMGMDMGALVPDAGGVEGGPEVGTPERPDNPRMKQIEKDRALAQRHQEEMTTRREKLHSLGQRMMGVQGIAQV